MSCQATHTVTAAEVEAGVIFSTAYASDGVTESNRAQAHVVKSGFPYYLITPNPASVDEGDGSIEFTVNRLGHTNAESSVRYATANGTAEAGKDFTATEGVLTFAANATTRTFTVPILEDFLDEDGERFTVALTLPSDANQRLAQAIVDISDNDPQVAFGVEWTKLHRENVGEVEMPVTLYYGSISGGRITSERHVSVQYQTRDDTATAGEDYEATSGRLEFAPGEGRQIIRVKVIDDRYDESRETFWIDFSNPKNGKIETASHDVVIADNDRDSTAATLDLAPAEVAEGAGATEITVTAEFNGAVRSDDVELTIAVAGRGATEGGDFAAVENFTLTIPAGSVSGSASFDIAPVDDAIAENAESIAVTGSTTASGITVRPQNGKLLRIVDNDERGVRIDPTALDIDEGLPPRTRWC